MAVETIPIPLGFKAPDFTLLDTNTGENKSLSELSSDLATVVMFICNHCPYVKHINQGLNDLAKDYQPKGVSFIAISSNDVENYPDDSPEKMKDMNYPFSYLYDETQQVARDYNAACTPDFSIFNGDSCAENGVALVVNRVIAAVGKGHCAAYHKDHHDNYHNNAISPNEAPCAQ